MAETLVLTNESKEKFDQLMQDYIDRFHPKDNVEMGLINEMVAARWRQQRLWMVQSASLDLEQDRLHYHIEETMLECSEPTRISIAFNSLAKDNGMDLLMRYETSYSRMHDRAMKTLERLQAQRRPQEEPPQIESPKTVEPTPVPPVVPIIPIACEPIEPKKQNLRNDAKPWPFPPAIDPSGPPDGPSPESDVL
jgi:hypothetical protein